MYDTDICLDDLSSDATSAVKNGEKQTSKKKNVRRSSSTRTLISEQDKFCCLSLEPRDVDLLKWWKNNRSIISELGNTANKMLCSPPSSVESERLFSIGGDNITLQRNNAGDCGEINASEPQSVDPQFQLQETK